jgi:predicted PurR-regulated permease PerM
VQRLKEVHSWVPLVVVAVGLVVLYLLWDILSIFILAAFFAFVLNPIVGLFERKIPRFFAITSVYLLLVIIAIIVVGSLAPLISHQFKSFVNALPTYFEKIRDIADPAHRHYLAIPDRWQPIVNQILAELQSWAVRLAKQIAPTLVKFFTSFLTILFIPLLAFFMLLGSKGYKEMFIALIPQQHRPTIEDLLRCSSMALWNFIKGEIVLMAVVGTLVGVGLHIIGMPYATIFGILAGLLEVVPSLGPTVTTLIVVIIGLAINPWLSLKGGLVTVVVQLLENYLIAPSVMSKALGLDPVTVILAVLLGGMLGGIKGVLVAIPLAVFVKIVLLYFYADHDLPAGRAICPSGPPVKPSRSKSRRK